MRLVLVASILLASCGDGSATPDAGPPPADAAPADAASPDANPLCDPALPHPGTLSCAGLYDDLASRTLAAGVREYAPGFQLWSDGAGKTRWIYLPPGTTIDVTDQNEWTFPVGTKLFKEFRLAAGDPGGERPIETRMLWKQSDDAWQRVTYRWNDDLSAADELTDGEENVLGTTYAIPPQSHCGRCHQGRVDNVLGFEAISLAAPEATGLTYALLQQEGLLSSSNGNHLVEAAALQVPGTAGERAAISYLHENCGVACHSPNVGGARFSMRLEVEALGSVADTAPFQNAINQPSTFVPAGAPMGVTYYRLRPTDASRSVIHHRMSVRDAASPMPEQMPPIATNLVDDDGLAAVLAWIEVMTPANGYPDPAP